MGNFSKNARLQKKNDFYVIWRNNKFNRDEIVEKRCSFQRSFYIQLPEITKCVESVKNEKLIGMSENCPEVFHACVNVTGNEKNTGLLLQTTVH